MPMGMPPMVSLDQRWFVLMLALVSQPPSVLLGKYRVALFHEWCSSDLTIALRDLLSPKTRYALQSLRTSIFLTYIIVVPFSNTPSAENDFT